MRYVLIMLVLAGCHQLKEGNVISKSIEPARTYIYLMPISHTMMVGKSCTTSITYIPMTMYDDEDFKVQISGNDGKEDRIETFYVSKKQWECLRVGDYFQVTTDCSTSPNKDIEQ